MDSVMFFLAKTQRRKVSYPFVDTFSLNPYLILIFIGIFFSGCHSFKKTAEVKQDKQNSQQDIRNKYAEILKVDQEKISYIALYSFINEWYQAPYKYSGKTKLGIDCSGFSSVLYKEIFNKEISSSSESIFKQCESISRDNLKEGDLVFFKIDSNKISHVGVYLQNNKFVHATTKSGVIISDLNEAYYSKYYFKGGRVK